MKKKVNNCSNLDASNGEVLQKKERHIVSWSQEEDDILREQIRLHGSENWAIIASKFKDKTTRQCRRRWFTYLNSDFKKGGWSPEEDMLLCEAQRIYGNRWTEIAKVVSGRTDNAVKNRFTTLCKKRAKREALVKENSITSYVNLNNKRVIFRNGLISDEGSENGAPLKKIRTCISSITENCTQGEHSAAMENKFLPMFLKKDDPKVLALMQQAELLSSLAIKVNTEKTDQSLESAWMVLQDFMKQNKESKLLTITNGDADFQLEKFKESAEDIRCFDEGSRSSWRELDVYESSPTSSEYSTESTLMSNVPSDKTEECDAEITALHQETGHVSQAEKLDQHCLLEENGVCHVASTNEVKSMPAYEDIKAANGAECEYPITEFSSPTHVTPLFRALAATIPSPKFSESDWSQLLRAQSPILPNHHPARGPSSIVYDQSISLSYQEIRSI
ncbi:Duplicated homeodomain-like superfamily protein [Perilla frutescens var. frutescens]|nr:Duplicated homeodomain-like superfamily protein [Perilla frutescens var. frutescens]